jgi:uncharacterized membrane protein YdjX (TVP38/TMEM64 family)
LAFFYRKRFLLLLILLAALAGLVYFLFFTRAGVKLTHSNMQQLSDHLRDLGLWGKLIGMLLVFLQTFFPFIPFVVVAGTNVAVFGFHWGFIVNYLMSCLGAVSAFFFARYYAHDWVERKLLKYPSVSLFSKKMESHGFLYVLIGRLIPILPSAAINFGAALTRMKFRPFFWGTCLGKLPIVFMESMIAHDLFHFRHYRGRLLLLLIAFGVLLLIGNWLKKKLLPKA